MPKNLNNTLGINRQCKNLTCSAILKPYQHKYCSNKCHAIHFNVSCYSVTAKKIGLANARRNISKETRKRMAESAHNRAKFHEPRFCKVCNEKLSNKQQKLCSKKCLGIFHRNRYVSPETRKKQRVAALEYINKTRGKCSPNLGKNEAALLNKQEQIDSCKILRQHHIKNLGYFVDGYCSETNTVYEVYEKWHDKQIDHDIRRQQEIQNQLKCKFIIINP